MKSLKELPQLSCDVWTVSQTVATAARTLEALCSSERQPKLEAWEYTQMLGCIEENLTASQINVLIDVAKALEERI